MIYVRNKLDTTVPQYYTVVTAVVHISVAHHILPVFQTHVPVGTLLNRIRCGKVCIPVQRTAHRNESCTRVKPLTVTPPFPPLFPSRVTVLPHGDVDSWGVGFSVPIENNGSGGGVAQATTTTKCPFNPLPTSPFARKVRSGGEGFRLITLFVLGTSGAPLENPRVFLCTYNAHPPPYRQLRDLNPESCHDDAPT